MQLELTGSIELGRRLRERDPLVLSEIYDRYARLVFSIILRYVRNIATAEDLTQETFLRVWNRSETFDGTRGKLSSWIVTVAKNSAINHLRSVESRQEGLTINLTKLESTRSFSGEKDFDRGFYHRQQVQKGFLKLSETHIRILKMAYYDGLTHTEIAANLERPLGTVKSCIRAALQNLKGHLAMEESLTWSKF